MLLIPIHDPVAWDRALLSLPNPHILQSWSWGEFKSRYGWAPIRVLFQEGGQTLAAALILKRRLSRLPVSILYVPKGPALDWTDAGLAEQVLVELEHLARQQRSLFLKIDPDIYYPDQVPAFSPRPTCAREIAHLLQARGWRFSDDQIQFRNTLLLDLVQSEDELLAAMKPKTRYNLGLAARRGVTVHHVTAGQAVTEAVDVFYRLYAETARRDGFVIRSPAYYHDAWGTFLKEGQACLLLAEYEGEAVAGLLLFTFGPTAWYMYGASSDRHRQHMPNHLLQWEAIRWARAAGYTLYDLWGAPDSLDESDPMWGVVRFKLGLGSQLAQGLGAWDYAANRTGYRLYTEVIPRYLSWMRRRQEAGPKELRNL